MSSGRCAGARRRAGPALARAVLASGLLWLAGCGGGGGGAVEEPTDPGGGGGGTATLVLDGPGGPLSVTYAMESLDLLSGLAELASAQVDRATPGRFSETVGCRGGQDELQWVDADGSGTLTAGDRVEVQLNACDATPWFFTPLSGSLSIQVLAVTSGSLRAQVTLDPAGLRIRALAQLSPDIVLAGSFIAERQLDSRGGRIAVAPGPADDLRRIFPEQGSIVDRWQQPQLTRAVRRDLPQVSLTASMQFDSSSLGGRFELSTPSAVLATLYDYPLPMSGQGMFRVTGARGDLLLVQPAVSQSFLKVRLDRGGDGSVEEEGGTATFWYAMGFGHLWRDLAPSFKGGLDPLVEPFRIVPSFDTSARFAVADEIRLQFNRLPAPGGNLRYHLVDEGRLPDGSGGGADVPTEVVQDGALVRIRPLQRLRYSNRYLVRIGGGPSDSGHDLTIQDIHGSHLTLPRGEVGRFETPDELRPVATAVGASPLLEPGATVTLKAEGLPRPDRVARYEWVRIDGAPLVFSAPGAAQTDVGLAAPGAPWGTAAIGLTVTHLDGSTESSTVRVETTSRAPATDAMTGWLEIPAGALPGQVDAVRLASASAMVSTSTGHDLQVSFGNGSLDTRRAWDAVLRLAPDVTIAPGRFAGRIDDLHTVINVAPEVRPAFQFYFTQAPGGPPTEDCVGGTLTIDLLEFETDAFRGTVRAAADVVVQCAVGTAPLRLSVRVRSDLPLPP